MLYSTHVKYGMALNRDDAGKLSIRVCQPQDIKAAGQIKLITVIAYVILVTGLFSMIVLQTPRAHLAIPLFITTTIVAIISIVSAYKKLKFHDFILIFTADGTVQWVNTKGRLVSVLESPRLIYLDIKHPRFSSGSEECGLAIVFGDDTYLLLAIGDRHGIDHMKTFALSTGVIGLSESTLRLKSNIAGMIDL